jgi:hypothetical protein
MPNRAHPPQQPFAEALDDTPASSMNQVVARRRARCWQRVEHGRDGEDSVTQYGLVNYEKVLCLVVAKELGNDWGHRDDVPKESRTHFSILGPRVASNRRDRSRSVHTHPHTRRLRSLSAIAFERASTCSIVARVSDLVAVGAATQGTLPQTHSRHRYHWTSCYRVLKLEYCSVSQISFEMLPGDWHDASYLAREIEQP